MVSSPEHKKSMRDSGIWDRFSSMRNPLSKQIIINKSKGKRRSIRTEFKRGSSWADNFGKEKSIIMKEQLTIRMSRNNPNRNGISDSSKIKMSLAKTKETIFTGFREPYFKRIRFSREYSQWRKAVFIRDNYTCRNCNSVGGCLEAHHIKPFSVYPLLRFDIDNGITYCNKCHKSLDLHRGRFK